MYVSLNGSGLVEKDHAFSLVNDHDYINVKFHNRNALNSSFRLEQCQIDEAKQSAKCESGDLMDDPWREAMYQSRPIDDLGTTVEIISRFPVQRLELEASPRGLKLTKKVRFLGTGEVVSETLRVKRLAEDVQLACPPPDSFAPLVPERLVNHLE